MVRALDGTLYSISNAELRTVANRTRIYASAEVKVRGIRQGDLRRVIEIMERVSAVVADDPELNDALITPHTIKCIDDADELGGIAVLPAQVVAGDRWRVASRLRIALDEASAREGIELNRKALTERALMGRG